MKGGLSTIFSIHNVFFMSKRVFLLRDGERTRQDSIIPLSGAIIPLSDPIMLLQDAIMLLSDAIMSM